MLETLFALSLIAHGLVHAGLAAAPAPKDPDPKPGQFFIASGRSRLLESLRIEPSMIRSLAWTLVSMITVGFVLAGLGLLILPSVSYIWLGTAFGSAALSIILLVVFWHPWLVVGVVLDVAILAVLVSRW